VPVIERAPIAALLASTHGLHLDTPAEQAALRRTESLVKDKLAELRQTIDLRRAGRAAEALDIVRQGRGKRSMDAMRAALVELRDEERRQLEQSDAERRQVAQRAYLSSIAGCVVALCAILLLARSARRAQRSLAHQEEQFHTLADNISQHAWTASSDGRFEWFNRRWEEYTGLAGGDFDLQWR
jgi:PAS domain-containing protein